MRLTVADETVFVATGGRPFDSQRPALVFLHGAAMDHTVWFMLDRYFAHHGFAVAAVDLPGHGRSGGAALTTIAELADWTAHLLDALAVERAIVVGHSLGALTALECAARHASRIAGLGLCGVAARMAVHPDLLTAAQQNDHVAFDLVNAWGHGKPAHRGGHPWPGMWMMAGALRLMEHSRPGVLHTDLLACDSYTGAEAAARQVRCPTLFVLGAVDQMSPPKAARPLIAAMADTEQVVLPGCGHMMMVEQPHGVINALRAFADGVPA